MLDRRSGEPSCRDIPAREDQGQPVIHARPGNYGQADEKADQEVMTTEYQRLNFGPYLP